MILLSKIQGWFPSTKFRVDPFLQKEIETDGRVFFSFSFLSILHLSQSLFIFGVNIDSLSFGVGIVSIYFGVGVDSLSFGVGVDSQSLFLFFPPPPPSFWIFLDMNKRKKTSLRCPTKGCSNYVDLYRIQEGWEGTFPTRFNSPRNWSFCCSQSCLDLYQGKRWNETTQSVPSIEQEQENMDLDTDRTPFASRDPLVEMADFLLNQWTIENRGLYERMRDSLVSRIQSCRRTTDGREFINKITKVSWMASQLKSMCAHEHLINKETMEKILISNEEYVRFRSVALKWKETRELSQ